MKNHVKVYLEHHGYKALYFDDLFIPCIWCSQRSVDIHHVDGRKRGGSKLKDTLKAIEKASKAKVFAYLDRIHG